MTTKGMGVRKSPKKVLDYCGAFRTGDIELPSSFMLERENIPDVRDQGRVNSCVGFAITNIMQILNQHETGLRDRFSPGYVYGKCRDDDDKLEGMNISNALDYLIKTGACFESDFPYNVEVPEIIDMVKSRPELNEKAKPYRIKGYEVYAWAYKERKYKDIKTALFKYHTPILTSTEYYGGGHAICIVGWDDDTEEFIILNSWGKDWEDNGMGKLPYDEVEKAYLLIDETNDNLMPFEDVSPDKWYYQAVRHVYNAGLMNGTSDSTFDPEKTMTRAEMAQVLVNLCKKIDSIA